MIAWCASFRIPLYCEVAVREHKRRGCRVIVTASTNTTKRGDLDRWKPTAREAMRHWERGPKGWRRKQ